MRLPGAEPRRGDRLAAAPEVAFRLEPGGPSWPARLLSLSWGTITVLAAEPPEVETRLVFELPVPGAETLVVGGLVAFSHARAPGDSHGLLGAALEVDGPTAAALDRYLRAVGPLPGDEPSTSEELRVTVPGLHPRPAEEFEPLDDPTEVELSPFAAEAPRALGAGPRRGAGETGPRWPEASQHDQVATVPGAPAFDDLVFADQAERLPTRRHRASSWAARAPSDDRTLEGPPPLRRRPIGREDPDLTIEDDPRGPLAGNPWATAELRERASRILPLPHPLGPYVLLLPIGVGGMATVYLARAASPGGLPSLVAVKVVHRHLAGDPYFLGAFLREARLAAQLRHPNVAQVLELDEAGGTHYLAMECVLGESLRTAGRRLLDRATGYMDARLACSLAAQVAEGLHAAHELRDLNGQPLGIVHRDVTPHNLLVSYEGTVKLVDFGVARASSSTHATAPRAVKGKFPYMSPEQVWGLGIDRRADVFSLGVVLWELLTGKRLFKRDDPVETLRLVSAARVPAAGTIRPGIPFALDRVVARALARNPDERYGSAAELRDALADAVGPLGGLLDVHGVGACMEAGFADEARDKRATVQRLLATPAETETEMAPAPPPPHPEADRSALAEAAPAPRAGGARALRAGRLIVVLLVSTLLAAALTVGLLAAVGPSAAEPGGPLPKLAPSSGQNP